ncbi:MAG: Ig-like domain-containing protein [Patescibacteria group bacterium]
MKKGIFLFVSFLVFAALAFFTISSRKTLFKNSDNKAATTTNEARQEETSEVIEKENEISLEITSPEDGSVVSDPSVLVKGTTVANADVFVNDAETKADKDGNFKVNIDLEEGGNEIFVTANDVDGNYAEGSVKITLNTE